ncbi:MAG TPA: hypothetical protein VNZ57_04545, partial [Longimicrobiales bacterium]|nr:hypothetical protein [Longimicrobiales bacterium]
MEVHLARTDDDLGVPARGDVRAGPRLHGEVGLRHGELALEEPLVYGAELADAERAEVDRPHIALGRLVENESGERG